MSMKRTRFLFLPVLALLILLVGLLGLVSQHLGLAHAANTITVTTCPTEAMLIEDIAAAGPAGTVLFNISSPCTIPITSRLTITSNLTLNNVGQQVTLDGQDSMQIFFVIPTVTLNLNALTIAHGSAVWNNFEGGGLFAGAGSIVNITNSTFDHNSAGGTPGCGGGLFAAPGSIVNITNSTFANNTANNGGGIFNNAGTVNIRNSTIADNTADPGGGTADPGTINIAQSIVANNIGGDCSTSFGGTIIDQGYNLSSDNTCGFTAKNYSLPNTNPKLDPAGLANNGGPTQTIALEPGSPAIDYIPAPSVCTLTSDQRGFPRPDNNESFCDIGAYEFQDAPVPSPSPSPPPPHKHGLKIRKR